MLLYVNFIWLTQFFHLIFTLGTHTNYFSEFLAEQSKDYIDSFNKNMKNPLIFKPIKFDLSDKKYKKIEIELRKK